MEKIRGIVIDVTRHNDRYNIVTLFTRSRGRVAFLSPVGSGKSGRMRGARLNLLSEIEAEVRFRPASSLQMLGAVSLAEVHIDMYCNPVKSTVVMFVAEFLNRLLRAAAPEPQLYDYISGAIGILDGMDRGVADFHIVFMVSLLPFMGIQPDLSGYETGDFFDMRSSVYVADRPLHNDWVGGEEAAGLRILQRISYVTAASLHLNGVRRRRISAGLLRYYTIHYPGVDNIKSFPVLVELFA